MNEDTNGRDNLPATFLDVRRVRVEGAPRIVMHSLQWSQRGGESRRVSGSGGAADTRGGVRRTASHRCYISYLTSHISTNEVEGWRGYEG